MRENRDQNLYKNELRNKNCLNFPLGLIFAQIWSDLGLHFLSIFLLSGLAVCPKFGFRDKVGLARPLGVIFDRLLVVFCMLFETDKHLVGEIAIHPGTHSVGIWVVGFNS